MRGIVRRCRGRSAVVAALTLLVGPAWAAAQQVGTVVGSVTDVRTGRSLAGAQVFVPGSSAGALSGSDGRYLLTGVPVGSMIV